MSETKYLTPEDVETVNDIRYVDATAWGGTLRFGSLPAEDMIEFLESNEGPAKKTAAIRIIVKSWVDADGKRIGTEKHIQMLKKKDSATISELVGVILKLNKLGQKGQLEEIKNESGEAITDASRTVLH
jgi:hypothetical protein